MSSSLVMLSFQWIFYAWENCRRRWWRRLWVSEQSWGTPDHRVSASVNNTEPRPVVMDTFPQKRTRCAPLWVCAGSKNFPLTGSHSTYVSSSSGDLWQNTDPPPHDPSQLSLVVWYRCITIKVPLQQKQNLSLEAKATSVCIQKQLLLLNGQRLKFIWSTRSPQASKGHWFLGEPTQHWASSATGYF